MTTYLFASVKPHVWVKQLKSSSEKKKPKPNATPQTQAYNIVARRQIK